MKFWVLHQFDASGDLACPADRQTGAGPKKSQSSTEFFEPVQPLLDDIQARRIAEAQRSIVAERDPWNHRDISLAKKPVGEVLGREPKLADIDQDVKCAIRTNHAHVRHFGKSLEHVFASQIKLIAHVNYALLITSERGETSLLGE